MNKKLLEWSLRLAVFGEFLGHGVFALQGKEGWFKYFNAVGIYDVESMKSMLFFVGLMDITLAVLVLVRPMRGALLWMALWGLWTAMIRWPIGPDPVWDFVERWANWGAPLALFAYYGWPRHGQGWFSSSRSMMDKVKDAVS